MQEILPYFLREMAYLKKSGRDFAHRFPGVASALDFGPDGSRDPHVKQLLEAFAFLTARIQRNIDESLGDLAGSVLETLAPSFVRPLPAISILQMILNNEQGKVTNGFNVGSGSECYTRAISGTEIRFRTCWDTLLWPLKLNRSRIVELSHLGITDGIPAGTMGLALDFEITDGTTLDTLNISELDIYFDGELQNIDQVRSAIVSRTQQAIWVSDDTNNFIRVSGARVAEIGFERDESLYPIASPADIPFSLVRSYASFPRAFNFLRIKSLGQPKSKGGDMTLVIALERPVSTKQGDFDVRLGCVPIVNLFKRTSEPIDIDSSSHEFMLNGDLQTARSEEVYSVNSISRVAGTEGTLDTIPALGRMTVDSVNEQMFWTIRRAVSMRNGLTGSDTFVGFVNAKLQPTSPRDRVIYADLLCSNRSFAEQLSPEMGLLMDGGVKNINASIVHSPSASIGSSIDQSKILKYLGFLNTNRQTIFNLAENDNGERLKLFLNTIVDNNPVFASQVGGILGVRASSGVYPLIAERNRFGLCSGIDLTIDVDTRAFAGGSLLVFGSVLSHALAHFVNVNSFVRLKLESEGQKVHEWNPMTGYQTII